jgi:hypothetical protein
MLGVLAKLHLRLGGDTVTLSSDRFGANFVKGALGRVGCHQDYKGEGDTGARPFLFPISPQKAVHKSIGEGI